MSENNNEKKRYSFKDYSEQIMSITNATETIKVAVEQMPECSAKKAFVLSIENLTKKLERFGKERAGREKLTDEEKEVLRKFRAGELSITPTTEKENEVSTIEVKKGKKHGGKQ